MTLSKLVLQTQNGYLKEVTSLPIKSYQGSYEFITDGTVNGGTGWVTTVNDASSFNVNTDDVNWVQFQGEGTFTAGVWANP